MDRIGKLYRSRMRIKMPDGIREVDGQWHFSPEGALMIPFLHPYLALEWHRGDLDYPGRLGEVRGSQRVAGLPDNPRYLGTQYLGTEADWCGETDYPDGFAVEVDAEGCPVDCVELPLGEDGHYLLECPEERQWSVVVYTGPAEDGAWDHERSWHGLHKTHAHYVSAWAREHSWRGPYTSVDHFPGSWSHERSWAGTHATTAHYASSWGKERSWEGVYETTDHVAAEYDQERSWQAVVNTVDNNAAAWDQERSWQGSVATLAHYTASWDREQSWQGVYETLDHFAGDYDHERSWRAVVKTSGAFAASWDQERSYFCSLQTSAAYAASWDREHQWSAGILSVDNVTNFNCGTIVAAGTTQGTATAIANDTVSATSTGANQGIILPAGCYRVVVHNANAGGGNGIIVYPPSGAKIGSNSTNQGVMVAAQGAAEFVEITSTQWRQVNYL